jgi:uncharacterized membrane protein YjjP (DUF1212 family)
VRQSLPRKVKAIRWLLVISSFMFASFFLVELLHGPDLALVILFVLGLPGGAIYPVVSWIRHERELGRQAGSQRER